MKIIGKTFTKHFWKQLADNRKPHGSAYLPNTLTVTRVYVQNNNNRNYYIINGGPKYITRYNLKKYYFTLD